MSRRGRRTRGSHEFGDETNFYENRPSGYQPRGGRSGPPPSRPLPIRGRGQWQNADVRHEASIQNWSQPSNRGWPPSRGRGQWQNADVRHEESFQNWSQPSDRGWPPSRGRGQWQNADVRHEENFQNWSQPSDRGAYFGRGQSRGNSINFRGGHQMNDEHSDRGNRFGRNFDDGQEFSERRNASTYVPEVRAVDEIFLEDHDHVSEYRNILDQDEDVIVTGLDSDMVKLDTWNDAELNPQLAANIDRAGYIRPRKIQAYAIPLIMQGLDLIGQAETGSGKTAAFAVPIIDYISKNKPEKPIPACPYAIIIGSTRELTLQIYEQTRKLADMTGVTVAKAYGQIQVSANRKEIYAGCDILCATPGRLKSFIQHGDVLLRQLKFLVFDEADKLMEESFLVDIREIIAEREFPQKNDRQTLMFSATFEENIQRVCKELLREDSVMVANKQLVITNHKVYQIFHVTYGIAEKKFKLLEILQEEFESAKIKNPDDPKIKRTLVFVQKKRDTETLSLWLTQANDIPATIINGDQDQETREKALREFRSYRVPVLISTDVCARGIDIKHLDHVINMDLPNEPTTYVHRIGRTGRLKEGFATSFFDPSKPEDRNLAPSLIKFLSESNQTVPDFIEDCVRANAPHPPFESGENIEEDQKPKENENYEPVDMSQLNEDW